MRFFKEFLDKRRYFFLLLPVLLAGIFFIYSDKFIKFLPFKYERKSFSNFINKYQGLINIKIPKERRFFNEKVFDYLVIIKANKTVNIKEQGKNKSLPVYNIELIYTKGKSKYVIINGKIYREGDKISDKEYIVKIEKDGILINGYWGLRWIKL